MLTNVYKDLLCLAKKKGKKRKIFKTLQLCKFNFGYKTEKLCEAVSKGSHSSGGHHEVESWQSDLKSSSLKRFTTHLSGSIRLNAKLLKS